MLSFRRLAVAVLYGELTAPYSPLLYQAATLSFNYFELGAVRRGLGSTLVYLLGPNRLLGTAAFHVLSAAAVSAVMASLFARVRGNPGQLAVFVLVAVALMRRWAEDTGRTDMLVAAALGVAALCVRRGHVATAGAIVTTGVFVHETSVIYGVPLLLALLLDGKRHAGLGRGDLLRLGIAMGVPMAIYAGLGWLPRADLATAVETVRAALPSHKYVDWAIFFASAGSRGVSMAVCQNLLNPLYPLHIASAVLMMAFVGFALAGTRRRLSTLALVASLPPVLFLAAAANDMSRWTILGAFSIWVLCACSDEPPPRREEGALWVRLALAFALILLLNESKRFPVSVGIYTPSPFIEHWAVRAGAPPTPTLDAAFEECDPRWRDFLDPAEPAVSR